MFIAAITLAAALGGHDPLHHGPTPNAGTHRTQVFVAGAPLPLNRPMQLALDGQGNIYVADSAANAIVVYNSAFKQQTNRTIGNLNVPTGVALDPYGNIFAVNSGANTVTEFSSGGVAQTIFSTGLNRPNTVAVDPLDDVYVVNNNYSSLSIFQKSGALAHSYRDGQPSGSLTAVALSGPTLVTGQSNALFGAQVAAVMQTWDADSLVTGNIAQHPTAFLPTLSFAIDIKVDASGAVWAVDNRSNRILYQRALDQQVTTFRFLGFTPGGIAVDSIRGLIYVSDVNGGSVHVYNRQGQHLTTFM